MARSSWIPLALFLHAAPAAPPAPGQAPALPAPDQTIRRLAHAAREADLKGQWVRLGEVHDRLGSLRLNPTQQPWIDYYLAYVDWRRSSLAWIGEGPGGSAALQRQCVDHLTRALALAPGFSEARAMLVMCEASMASAMPDSVAAIIPRVGANLQLLIAEAPENPRGRLIRYMLTALSPRTDTARREAVLREWRELAQHFPESKDPSEPEWGRAECWGWLGAVLLARGRPDEAAEAFERALADRGDFWWVRVIALPQARASRLPHLGGQAGDAPQGD